MAVYDESISIPAEVSTVIFDVDGTLYDQRRLRSLMVREMLSQFARGSFGPSDFMGVMCYRAARERWAETRQSGLALGQYQIAARELGRPAEVIQSLVEEWIERRPLRHLKACRFLKIDQVFDRLRRRGYRTGVYSDYPAESKLDALGLKADAIAYSLEPAIGWLKPHPAVLYALMQRMSVKAEECLIIGDRVDRDGECANAVGARFLHRRDDYCFERILNWFDEIDNFSPLRL